MIFYFSGTGNSRYVAERIASVTGDEFTSLNDKIKKGESGNGSGCLVFVTPTYAWRIPKVVEEWIRRSDLKGEAWFVMTCGSEIGNAAKYNRRLCDKKGLIYMGTAQIVMPENYIAMFGAPEWPEAEKIIGAAEPDIERAGLRIKNGDAFPIPRNNLYDKIMSGVVNGPFYSFCVRDKDFTVNESCVGCGKCAALCPMNNIRLKDGKPVWGGRCTHCMACICRCPAEAIEYGTKSVGKPRYICRKTE